MRPPLVRAAVKQILPPRNPKKPPLGALRITIFGREEIEVDASQTPGTWKTPYYWVVYFEPAGTRGFSAIVHHKTTEGDSIPIPGDYGRYYVAAQSLTGKITGKSNIVTQTADSPYANPPQKAAAAGKPKIAVRIRAIAIPGESERAVEVVSPRTGITWDEWEVRLDGRFHSRHETDFDVQGNVIRLDPAINGRVTVVGTLDQRPVTRESNPVRLRPVRFPPRRPPSAPPTASPIKVARSDRRFFGTAA